MAEENKTNGKGPGSENIPDLNDVTFDENGKIKEVYDPESKQTFKTPGQDDASKGDPGKKPAADAGAAAAKGNEGGGTGDEIVLEFDNFADLIVNKIMGNNINFKEKYPDGIPEEEQAKIITESVEDIINHYEGEIEKIKKGGVAATGLTEYEQTVVKELRAGKKLSDISSQETVSVDLDDKDAVVKYMISTNNPEWTPEEVADEVQHLKDSKRFDRHYKSAKGEIEAIQKDYEKNFDLNQKESLKKIQQQERDEELAEQAELKKVSDSNPEIYGIQLDPEMKNLAMRFVTERNKDTGNTYLQDLLSTPEGVLEVAYLKLFGKHITDALKQGGFKEGFNQKLKEQFSDDPKHNAKDGAFLNNKYDMNKLVEVDQIGS